MVLQEERKLGRKEAAQFLTAKIGANRHLISVESGR